MKTNTTFELLAHTLLSMLIAFNLLAIPNQSVAARALLAEFTDCAAQSQIPQTECDALVVFYTSMGGATWSDNTGWLQTDTPCTWVGITCANGTNITTISFIQNNLTGAIPAELANLPQLTTLELIKNGDLSGTSIPAALGSLTQLTTLNFKSNGLTGSIPTQLENLVNLTTLDLSSNDLSGGIPSGLGNLTNLARIDLSGNLLSNNIPSELGNMLNLTILDLSSNTLSGPLPIELGNLTSLTVLYLNDNTFSGSIPTTLGNLVNLTTLALNNNTLSGAIPTEFGNLINLNRLWLNNNSLSGSIPAGLSNMTQLDSLNLSNNLLSGSIPAGIGNLIELRTLNLSNNTFTGPIPTELGNLTELDFIQLNNNSFSGTIPVELGSLTNVITLDLSNNILSGSIPTEFGKPNTNLNFLYLNDNLLSGEFPASIINLNNLQIITFDCELTSFDPDVVAFIDERVTDWPNTTCPALVSPSDGATLDNGRLDKLDDIVWDFDWSDVPGATKYQLYASHLGDAAPLIDNANIPSSLYQYKSLNNYITPVNQNDWNWKTRAYINNQWGEWSELRSFSVEPLDTDASQILGKNSGFNTYPQTSRIPKYWKAFNFLTADGKSTSTKYEGLASIKITGTPGLLKTLSHTILVSGPAKDRLIFSYWAKGSAVPAAGTCKAQVSFYNGTTLKSTKTLKCPSGANYNFKKVKLNITSPTAYNKVIITFTYSKASGAVWFDAVNLIR